MTSPLALSSSAEVASFLMFRMRNLIANLVTTETAAKLLSRCRGALDVLVEDPESGILYCEKLLVDEPYAAAPLAFVAVGHGGHAADSILLRVLAGSESDVFDSAMHGLSLANASCLPYHVACEHPLADFAMRAFRRTAFGSQLGNIAARSESHGRAQQHLISAAARVGGSLAAQLARLGCNDQSPEVRKASLWAAARMGCAWLLDFCRTRISEKHDPEAIHMLGMIGSDADAEAVRGCVRRGLQPEAAVAALARLGRPEDAAFLLELLDHPPLAESAAHALRRMFAIEIPRGLPRQPPPGLSEEELDVWDTTGPIDFGALRSWWMSARHRYQFGARYQWNTLVSVDPLGPAFDSLPTCVQHDLYLRERFHNHDRTPDWELETWPWLRRSYA